jgi:hypothetical protein
MRWVFFFVLAKFVRCSAGILGRYDKRATALIVHKFVRNLNRCEYKRAIGTRRAVAALEHDSPIVSHEAGRVKVLIRVVTAFSIDRV